MKHAVHAFTYKDQNIVYDGLSQTLLTVDEVGLAVIKRYAEQGADDITASLADRFSEQLTRTALEEVSSLVNQNALFCDEARLTEATASRVPPLLLSGICLHVAHDCNMRCAYCFAGSGLYGGRPVLMEMDAAKAALDLLFEHAGDDAHLYVDFFGGEPLLNIPVVKATIAYGDVLAQQTHRQVTWSITTNGLALDEDLIGYLNDHEVNVIISMDGRPEVHNVMRVDRKGLPTYDSVRDHAALLYASRWPDKACRYGDGVYTYVRGTFSKRNLDFSNDVIHLYEQGFRHIAMEPVVTNTDAPWTLSMEDVEVLKQQYDRMVDFIVASRRTGDPLYFHHFELDVDRGPCLGKRMSGCGAGQHYLAVSPEGDIYPCHQFVGTASFLMGNLADDSWTLQPADGFVSANAALGKVACQSCFARYHCGGGCHANHWLLNHDLLQPDQLSCELIRKRLECALYLAATEATSGSALEDMSFLDDAML